MVSTSAITYCAGAPSMTISLVNGVNPLQTTLLELGIVSGRVALLLRSAEIQPVFGRFVTEWHLPFTPFNLWRHYATGRVWLRAHQAARHSHRYSDCYWGVASKASLKERCCVHALCDSKLDRLDGGVFRLNQGYSVSQGSAHQPPLAYATGLLCSPVAWHRARLVEDYAWRYRVCSRDGMA